MVHRANTHEGRGKLTLMSLQGALELGRPFGIVLNRDEGFGLLYPHPSVIGGGLFLGRGCDLE